MTPLKDLTGQRFGRLAVIERVENRGTQTCWRCRCDCGEETVVHAGALVSSNTQSCGCYRNEKIAQVGKNSVKDLTGQRFYRLTVIERVENRGKSVMWRCRCDCRTESTVAAGDLTAGKVRSCGCTNGVKDLTGQRFGRLTVIQLSAQKTKSRSTIWTCACSCGNVKDIRSDSLISGNTRSCGCLLREQTKSRFTIHGMTRTKEYWTVANHKRNEKKRDLDSEWTVEMDLALRDLFPACVVCGSTDRLAVDHVLPLSKGNGLKPGNAVRLCISCNSVKNNRSLTELLLEWQADIIWNAFKFKDYWERLNE